MNIINGRTLWLRNAKLMNDFSEIDYGRWCVAGALGRIENEWQAALDNINPSLFDQVSERFVSLENHRLTHTYILSLSEHLSDEDDLGRLSMWRAYGGLAGGVALVFSLAAFAQEPDGLEIYSSAVQYTDQDGYLAFLKNVIGKLNANAAMLRAIPAPELVDHISGFLHFAVLSTKHPAFAEERELRLITGVNQSSIADIAVEVVNGAPQVVWKLPLENRPAVNYTGDLKSVLRRVIVGPVVQPPIVNEALRIALAGQGITNAEEIVHTSWVPLRNPL